MRNNYVKKFHKMGNTKLTIAFMLVFVLAMSAGLMVLLQAKQSDQIIQTQNVEIVRKSEVLNSQLDGRVFDKNNLSRDIIGDDSILDEYIIVGDTIKLELPQQLISLLSDDSINYLNDIVDFANQLINDAKTDIQSDITIPNDVLQGRYWFSFDAG